MRKRGDRTNRPTPNFGEQFHISKLSLRPSAIFFQHLELESHGHRRSSSRREALKFKKTYNDYRCILDESYFRSRTVSLLAPFGSSLQQNILKPALHWDFDLFTLERLTAGFPLLHMATYVKKIISSFDFMCSILAALCHDIDHPGVNQSFILNSRQMLAMFYKACLLAHEGRLTPRALTHTVKTLILATDIARQSEFLQRFEIAIKCADISNPCRSWEVCSLWASFITEEFFKQGDREKRLNLPVLPTMDRENTTKAKVQIGFIKFLVIPLYTKWNDFMRNNFTRALLQVCNQNLSRWEAKDAEASAGTRRSQRLTR
ncbi:unnamed protein product [Schistocephalus solidus]|uniref:PDEase domain-containing protein n=1 Tax=Schistocephalus solidus TaxID=70667 RepID=A0A183SVE2_SCHSO|nr:unnamed protein product [Schistocephalus solidus]